MSLKLILSASLLAVGAVAFVALLPAFAASPDMKMLDPDSDGTVSMTEATDAANKKMMTADADHDGTLDSKEAGMDVTGVDDDKDGTLDKSRVRRAGHQAAFKAADTDSDGTLDAKELASPAGEKLLALTQ